jgi:AcrR family transcriptional regulator
MSVQTATPVVGLRERKKDATRRRIRRVALRLAQRRGVEHLTIEEISEAAEVSPRTFFNYFSCKEDALIADSHEFASELSAAIAARPPTEPALHALREAIVGSEALRSAPRRRAEALARHRLVRDNPSLLPRQLHQFAVLEQAILAGMAERVGAGYADDDLRPALLAALAVAVLRMATQRWAADDTVALSELAASAFDLLEHGID